MPLSQIGYSLNASNRLEHLSSTASPCVRLRVYQHQHIAQLLGIPPDFLPVFASLIGNDQCDYIAAFATVYRSPNYHGSVDRIDMARIAHHLALLQSMPASTKEQVNKILAIVVPQLSTRPLLDLDTMLQDLARSAASYILQPIENPCPNFPLHPDPRDAPAQARCRALYARAFKAGRLGAVVMQIIKHQIACPPSPPDMPELQSPGVSLGRPIRLWIYAFVDDNLTLPRREVTEYVRREREVHTLNVVIPALKDLAPSSTTYNPLGIRIALLPPRTRLQYFLSRDLPVLSSAVVANIETRANCFHTLLLLLYASNPPLFCSTSFSSSNVHLSGPAHLHL